MKRKFIAGTGDGSDSFAVSAAYQLLKLIEKQIILPQRQVCLERSQSQRTLKEARYYEGKASALQDILNELNDVEIWRNKTVKE